MKPETLETQGAKLTLYFDAPEWENKPAAAVGKFSCRTRQSGQDLLEQAISLVRSKGISRLIGPMDGDTWHSYRLVTESDGSPPFLMEPDNTPDTVKIFTAAGFAPIGAYFSARIALKQWNRDALTEKHDLNIETWDGENPEALFTQVFMLSQKAFAANAFYKPISLAAFLKMYMPIVQLLNKKLIFFARQADGTLAGFLFGIPNYAEGPRPETAILKTYASLAKGAGRLMSHAFHTSAKAMGYKTAIHALIHDDNLSALRSSAEGAEVFRRYQLLGLKTDG